jgi:hypothetical protein
MVSKIKASANTIVSAHGVRTFVRQWSVLIAAAVMLLAGKPMTFAAMINYGGHFGSDVTFVDVTEDSVAAPLFGAPIFSDNSMDFNPVGFDATRGSAGGSESTVSRLKFTVDTHTFAIDNIVFSESGDTTLAGNAAAMGTTTAVSASGTVTIHEADYLAITPIIRPFSLTFTPSGGTYSLDADGGGLPIFHTSWTGSATLNLSQILTQAAVPFTLGATSLSIDIVNTLNAASQQGTSASITKTDFGVVMTTVPEPATWALLGLGVLAFAARRRTS